MRLKRVVLRGFKSFPDHTTVAFGPGLTAIVGPNGCGKSNLTDAILWAFGEQSTKALRSDRMDEVIFTGTQTRKPLGLAEVSLTFDELAPGEISPPYDAFSELTVTRRLFRSGESEYLINKTQCRLRDIRGLVAETGAGLKDHSIIEQGRVESVINLAPLERRVLVEEAAGIAKYKMQRLEAERKMALTGQNLLRVTDILTEVKRQAGVLKRQAKQAEEYQRLLREIADLERRRAALEWTRLQQDWSRVDQEGRTVSEQVEHAKTTLERLEREESAGRGQQAAWAEAGDRDRQTLLDLERELSRAEAQCEALRAQQQAGEEEAARRAHELAELAQELDALTAQAKEAGRQHEETARLLTEQRQRGVAQAEEAAGLTKTSLRQQIEHERMRSFETATKMTVGHNRLVACEARTAEIRITRGRIRQEQDTLTAARARADQGLRPVALPAHFPGFSAVLAEVLRIPPAFEQAVEAVLGQRLASLIMEDHHAVKAAVEVLRPGQRRQTLLPREPRWARRRTRPRTTAGVLGVAADLVKAPAEYRPLVEYLLGSVVIVHDMETALTGWRTAGDDDAQSWTWVTVDGLIVSPSGEVSWGAIADDSLLAELRRLKDHATTLEAEQARLQADEAQGAEEASAVRQELAAFEAERREGEERLRTLQADLQRLEADIEAHRTAQTETQVGLASLEERLRHLEADRHRLTATKTQREVALAKRRTAVESAKAVQQETKAKVRALEAKGEELRKARVIQQRAIEDRVAAGRAEAERLRAMEESVRRQRGALEDLQRLAHEADVSLAALRVKMETLQASHPDLADPHPGPSPSEGEGEVPSPTEIDAKILTLRQRVERLGAVNLAAIEEFRALEERQVILSREEADLRQSLANLEETIKKINETIQERFCTTFEALAVKFQEAFTTFFGGGQAHLMLLDKANPLESGVEIMAQPPGRRQVNLSLLSGGEKALTAIALLFAGFLVRPSPFYILDEVDAALDEENVRRFAAALRTMAARAQILIVTHSKRTMEVADCLYGVTMEEPGLSTLIGVRLASTPSTEPIPA